MLQWTIKKLIGSKNQRAIKKMWPMVTKINKLEEELQSEPDEALRERTRGWQEALREIETKGLADIIAEEEAAVQKVTEAASSLPEEEREEKIAADSASVLEDYRKKRQDVMPDIYDEQAKFLQDILPEAFAVVKNGARRLCGQTFSVCDQPVEWNMVHFDVQLIGGMGLHGGSIAEMATGEGKTLVATLPVYLNALTGRGVHLITVNDYLARRDSEWMGNLYTFLGLTVGCIQNDQPPPLRRENYQCDITYGTNSEFGFDYLRDNGMASSSEDQVQRGHYLAVIDEVDSVLIDEARTPLIISGPVTVSTHQFDRFKPLVEQLVKKQNVECTKLMGEAKQLLEKDDLEEAGVKLFKVKLGSPRNAQLRKLMEDPELRKLLEKTELSYFQDTQKTALFALKEELYFAVDEKAHDADLMDKGRKYLNPDDSEAFVLPDLAEEFSVIDGDNELTDQERGVKKEELQKRLDHQGQRMHNISQLLKAYCLYENGKEYVVEENKVVIVDEGTGRKMPGRRWSDGLHQAVEAKEGVKIDKETQTLATITIQNYFRLYEKLAGMTGTAETEAAEFGDIYGLDLMVIPTNRPVARIDQNDRIYKTEREKFGAVIELIKERHAKGQPILVGTASVATSEKVARILQRQKIPHSVLNARYHRQEAEIIARAGRHGAVTVSTNMAGRGTDIKLGEGVADLGGLMVVGTERHESRRTDRQLRGRCARQGDPGESIFFISFEDSLMKNFGAAERMTKMMEKFGLEEGQELEHPWLNKSVETAQKRVEQRNYQWRKRVLDFDDVMNQQREVVYGYRNEVIESAEPRALIYEAIDESIPSEVQNRLVKDHEGNVDFDGLLNWVNTTFPLRMSSEEAGFEGRSIEENGDFVVEKVKEAYELKSAHEDADSLQGLERYIMLNAVDRLWQEHLYNMDALREGVNLRSYGQKDPLVEYKNEAYNIFVELMDNIKGEILNNLFRSTTNLQAFEAFLGDLGVQTQEDAASQAMAAALGKGGSSEPAEAESEEAREEEGSVLTMPKKRELPKVGRNEPCPCGSGKKFKQCCGRKA